MKLEVTLSESVEKVIEIMNNNERNMRYVSRHAKIPYGTLYDILVKKKYFFDQDRLDAINKVFGTLLVLK
jgi:hypothetical protein